MRPEIDNKIIITTTKKKKKKLMKTVHAKYYINITIYSRQQTPEPSISLGILFLLLSKAIGCTEKFVRRQDDRSNSPPGSDADIHTLNLTP